MALTEVPVDPNSFKIAMLMDSQPAMVYDPDQGQFSDEQQLDDEGRPIFTLSVAVQFEGTFGAKNEVMQVNAATSDKKDPQDSLFGKPVGFENLRARLSTNRRTNVSSLRFAADLVVPKSTGKTSTLAS